MSNSDKRENRARNKARNRNKESHYLNRRKHLCANFKHNSPGFSHYELSLSQWHCNITVEQRSKQIYVKIEHKTIKFIIYFLAGATWGEQLGRGIWNLLIILATPQNRSNHTRTPTNKRAGYCETQCPPPVNIQHFYITNLGRGGERKKKEQQNCFTHRWGHKQQWLASGSLRKIYFSFACCWHLDSSCQYSLSFCWLLSKRNVTERNST